MQHFMEKEDAFKKINFELSFTNFKSNFVDKFELDDLLQKSFTFDYEANNNIRVLQWKIYLDILPRNNNFIEWIETTNTQREFYKDKFRSFQTVKNYQIDPLNRILDV